VLNGDTIEAWIISDLLEEKKGTLDIAAFNSKGRKTFRKAYRIEIPANSSRLVAQIPLSEIKKADSTNIAVAGVLKVRGLQDRHDIAFLDEPKHIAFRKPRIKFTRVKALDRSKKKFEIRIVSDTLVKALNLQIRGAKATFSDNCFDMAPGSERSIVATSRKPLGSGELRRRLQVAYYR